MKFLIADDSDSKLHLLQAIVKKQWDGEILVAKSTDAAKTFIDEHPNIAAAFIDYEMPRENGPAVISYLKMKNPAAHIALVTSEDSRRYEDDARKAGAEEFVCINNPGAMEKLETLIVEWHVASSA